MEQICDVFVSDPMIIDQILFQYWVEGKEIEVAVEMKLKEIQQIVNDDSLILARDASGLKQYDPILRKLFVQDTQDQYRFFDSFEHFMCRPEYLNEQISAQISVSVRHHMNAVYYSLDDDFCRELVGRKLNDKTRTMLDDLSAELEIPLKSIRRQFDNLRRLATFLGGVVSNSSNACAVCEINQTMLLPWDLAAKYTAFLFLINSRVLLSKRKSAFLTAEDLEFHSIALQVTWGRGTPSSSHKIFNTSLMATDQPRKHEEGVAAVFKDLQVQLGTVLGMEVDRGLHAAIKDVKSINERKVLDKLDEALKQHLALSRVQTLRRKNFLKSFLQIGAGLSQSKEYRDLFEEIVKIGEYFTEAEFTIAEVDVFFNVLSGNINPSFTNVIKEESEKAECAEFWARYVTGIQLCLLKIYLRIN